MSPTSARPSRAACATGFTLIELLVVLVIMSILFGLVMFNYPRADQRLQWVKAAAEELAATCRQARALAMSRNATYAVVFHIENHPDSSGRVLNNRSGGHWYRIVGPSSSIGSHLGDSRQLLLPDQVDNVPAITGSLNGSVITSSPYTLADFTQSMDKAWVSEAHVLPAGKVRFLSLTDMDYGDYTTISTRRVPSGTISYPRPWFGWWDKDNVAGGGAGRWYPWGGYDPAIPGSGFYYWGPAVAPAYAPLDAQPVNSTNGATRVLDRWAEGQQNVNSSGNSSPQLPAFPGADILYEAGAPRPLVNGNWRDMSIIFSPTGEVRWGGTLPGRHCSMFRNGTVSGTPVLRGAAERCNGTFTTTGIVNQNYQAETGNFDRDSGGFFITLAPDVATDKDVFTSAEEIQKALMPMHRVFVSVQGEVRIVPVSLKLADTGGLAPFPTSESWFRSGTNMRLYFGQDRMVTGSQVDTFGTGIGAPEPGGPITRFLTVDMLSNRAVWLK